MSRKKDLRQLFANVTALCEGEEFDLLEKWAWTTTADFGNACSVKSAAFTALDAEHG